MTSEEQQAETKVEKQFTEIMKDEIVEKRETITENMVEKEINKIKRKKAGDRLGWKVEWIERGKGNGKSLAVLFNRIEEEGEIPKKCQLTTIKSVRKKGNQGKQPQKYEPNNDLKILYEMNKRSKVTINTPFRETGNIETEETVN